MEIIAYAIGIAAFVTGALAALFGVIHYRDATIWTTCIAIVLGVIGGFCWLQDREWKKDAGTHTSKERAMVVPVAFSGEPKVNTPFTAFVRYKNRSNVLAKDVRVVFFAYGVKKGEKPEFDIIEKTSPTGGAVFFLTPDEETTSYHTHNNGKPLTAKDIADVENGYVIIYAFGKIYYRDTPKCSHWTTFCVFYDPGIKQYSIYSEYNETDEIQCP